MSSSATSPPAVAPGAARPRSPWLPRALLAFSAWAAVLGTALATEHTRFGLWLFGDRSGALIYLGAQVILLLLALAASAMTLLRGRTRDRLIVAAPTAVLILYALMLLAGPG